MWSLLIAVQIVTANCYRETVVQMHCPVICAVRERVGEEKATEALRIFARRYHCDGQVTSATDFCGCERIGE